MTSTPFRSLWLPSCLLLLFAAAEGQGAPPRTFVVDQAKSRVLLHVGKAGLFKFAGHEHDVLAPVREGQIVADPADLGRSSVQLSFDAAALQVTGKGEPPADVPKVQETMRGPRVLDTARFPDITFRSEAVSGRESSPGVFELRVTGPLEVRGQAVRIAFSVRVSVTGTHLVAEGSGTLRQTDFGISPVSVAGVVKVKDELSLHVHFEADALP